MGIPPKKQHYKEFYQADDIKVIQDCTDIPMLCTKCNFLLAFVDRETKCQIRVKWRDLYVYCEDPKKFSINCRSCGHVNSVNRE